MSRDCWISLWLLTLTALPIVAQPGRCEGAATTTPAVTWDEPLEEAVVDPTATLTQVRFLDFYSPGNSKTSAQTNDFLIQPIIPVERLSFFPWEQIIRPTLKLSMLATGPSSHPITAWADTSLYDLITSQWPHLERWHLRWAIGTTWVFPTASDPRAGSNSWQVGPAAAGAFGGIPNLWVGFLLQNPISFAYAKSGVQRRSVMLFQPGFSYRLGGGWYIKSTDSVWNVNWPRGTPTTMPVSLGFGRVWTLGGQTLDTWTSGEWMAYRQNAGITPMYTVRFGLNFVFPEFVLGR